MQFVINLEKIPTVTAQMKRVSFHGGRPVFYEDAKLRDARDLFCAHLAQHKPDKPFDTAVMLTTYWRFKSATKTGWKTTKPDTDNLIKLFKDCMTTVGFWADDALVVGETTFKHWFPFNQIIVRVMNANDHPENWGF